MLCKARDFAVHSMLVRGYGADFRVVVLSTSGESEEAISSLFIDPIDLAIPSHGTGHISSDDVSWFNRQSACWPAHLLIQEAIYQASVSIRNFLVTADGLFRKSNSTMETANAEKEPGKINVKRITRRAATGG